MPTPWKRSPDELHKIYIANTEAFYKLSDRSLAAELDGFVRRCAGQLWSRSGSVTQEHADAANELYSKGKSSPGTLLWELTGIICESEDFLPPLFFWRLAEDDVKSGKDASRVFIRMLTNILLYLAAVNDDVSFEEAGYITSCADKLGAICDAAGVKKSKPALRASDFVTNSEPSFKDKYPQTKQTQANENRQAPVPVAADIAENKARDADELLAELDALIGLDEVKKDVKSLINLMRVRRLREENGLPVPPMSLHLVFTGNPGTGKTTVARLLAELYAAVGVLSKGQLVEVDRSGLVAGFVGQTALKTGEVIKSALGGVLFIDEAYSLAGGGENDFGREATEILLKAMEDNRSDLAVIVAGYKGPMEKFINSNPGLESRFCKYFFFRDYTGPELAEMFRNICEKNGYAMEGETKTRIDEIFAKLYEQRGENFGNGRDVRNLFERAVTRHADRISETENPGKVELMTFLISDLSE
ncbi:MAG: AAA family ATPase [Oscillospiraceae bacterium]|nr:AAA family ATPase [Oscillospiraceae bacterium]